MSRVIQDEPEPRPDRPQSVEAVLRHRFPTRTVILVVLAVVVAVLVPLFMVLVT